MRAWRATGVRGAAARLVCDAGANGLVDLLRLSSSQGASVSRNSSGLNHLLLKDMNFTRAPQHRHGATLLCRDCRYLSEGPF